MQTLKEEVRQGILTAAVKEFILRGYEKASMRAIAKAAGISVSNTYNYYPGKEQLFDAIMEPVYQRIRQIFKQSLQQSLGRVGGQQNFQSFIDGIVQMILQMEDIHRRLLIVLAENSAGTRYEKAREEITGLLRMHLAEAIRRPDSPARIEENQAYILDIIAANYLDGLMKVLKDFRSREWAEANLKMLLTYHVGGIQALI